MPTIKSKALQPKLENGHVESIKTGVKNIEVLKPVDETPTKEAQEAANVFPESSNSLSREKNATRSVDLKTKIEIDDANETSDTVFSIEKASPTVILNPDAPVFVPRNGCLDVQSGIGE